LRTSGKVAPVKVNPVPEIVAEWTVTAAVPVDVSVTGSVEGELAVTFPKLKVVGLTVSWGVVATPVPVRVTATVGLVEELLLMVSEPLTAPGVVGLN
jgi:hypothetical protein